MKRTVIFIFSLLCCVSKAAAQARLSTAPSAYTFKKVFWKKPAQAVFEIKNTGNRPLELKDVEPDCNCTMVSWRSKVIQPGESKSLIVVYDAQTLGAFQKGIALYTNLSEEPFYIWIKGKVTREETPDTIKYACKLGSLLSDQDDIEFENVRRGEKRIKQLRIFNSGNTPVQPHLMHLPPYLRAAAVPQTLRPQCAGQIILQLDSKKIHDIGLVQSTVYMGTYAGERIKKSNEMNVSVTLLPDLKQASANSANAPKAALDSCSVVMGEVNGVDRFKVKLPLRNEGKAPLVIKRLQVYNPGLNVSMRNSTIDPGKDQNIIIKLSKNYQTFRGRRRILLITNDPEKTMIIIDVIVKN